MKKAERNTILYFYHMEVDEDAWSFCKFLQRASFPIFADDMYGL